MAVRRLSLLRAAAAPSLPLAMLPLSVSSSGSGSSDPTAGQWWHADYEYAYVESCMMLALVCTALLLDSLLDSVKHKARDGYTFGDVRKRKTRRHGTPHIEREHSLHEALVNRAAGEFTVLGVLAFLVWSTNRSGGFNGIAQYVGPGDVDFALPKTGTDYLHMIEDVHMHLCLGMVLYFSFVLQVMQGAVRTSRIWEAVDLTTVFGTTLPDVRMPSGRSSTGRRSSTASPPEQLPPLLPVMAAPYQVRRESVWLRSSQSVVSDSSRRGSDTPAPPPRRPLASILSFTATLEIRRSIDQERSRFTLDTGLAWRKSFFRVIARMEERNLEQWLQIKEYLPVSRHPGMNCDDFREAIVNYLDGWFPFGKYLSMALKVAVEDMIEFAVTTWTAAALLMGLSGMLARWGHVDFGLLHPVYAGLTLCSLLAIWWWARHHENALGAATQRQTGKYPSQYGMLRSLQVLFFFVSYSTSRMVASRHEWHTWPARVVAVIVVFLSLHLLFACRMAETVARFVCLTSISEHLEARNWELLKIMLQKRHAGCSDSQLADLNHHSVLQPCEVAPNVAKQLSVGASTFMRHVGSMGSRLSETVRKTRSSSTASDIRLSGRGEDSRTEGFDGERRSEVAPRTRRGSILEVKEQVALAVVSMGTVCAGAEFVGLSSTGQRLADEVSSALLRAGEASAALEALVAANNAASHALQTSQRQDGALPPGFLRDSAPCDFSEPLAEDTELAEPPALLGRLSASEASEDPLIPTKNGRGNRRTLE